MEKHRCTHTIWNNYNHYTCNKPAKVQDEKGKWCCGIHSPEAVAKRKAKSDARYEEWRANIDAARKTQERERKILKAFRSIMAAARVGGKWEQREIFDKYKHLLEEGK